jgi:hypothetical protein
MIIVYMTTFLLLSERVVDFTPTPSALAIVELQSELFLNSRVIRRVFSLSFARHFADGRWEHG